MVAPYYPTGRRACLAGYNDMPVLDTTMTFNLLQLPRVNSRLIRIGTRLFELWSPNSLQLPFLPGLRLSSFRPSIPAERRERRYDGHAGKHDHLYVPQYALAETAHWPMMRRGEEVRSGDLRSEIYLPLTSQWKDEGVNGRLRATFVDRLSAIRRDLETEVLALRPLLHTFPGAWASRPTNPTRDQVEKLRDLRTWEDVVDRGVAVQRDLREKEAWVAWWHERLRQKASEFLLPRLRELDFPYADDQYIGVWVNGAPEETVLRYLAASIPCFIVHEFKGLVTGIADRDVCVQENFLRGTLLDTLLGDDNPYQSIARRQAMVLDSLPAPTMWRWRRRVDPSERAFPLHPCASSASRDSDSGPESATSSRDIGIPPRTAEPSLPSNSRALPSAPNASIDKYAAPAVVTRVIDSEGFLGSFLPQSKQGERENWIDGR
ncbi:hypothetical protein B0H13DRAFT_2342322 [Mycena leptocephala]|nr:hypothetical protein B0H13DRAFT_2342322 [Mycena leptocephala]